MMPEERVQKNVQESKKKYFWHFLITVLNTHAQESHFWRYGFVWYLLIKYNFYIISTARRETYFPPTKAFVCVQREQYPDGWQKSLRHSISNSVHNLIQEPSQKLLRFPVTNAACTDNGWNSKWFQANIYLLKFLYRFFEVLNPLHSSISNTSSVFQTNAHDIVNPQPTKIEKQHKSRTMGLLGHPTGPKHN
jgi:hypothetical protein